MSGSETTDKSAQRPDEHEATADEQDQDEETYPNGETWCEGPASDDLPCFDVSSMGRRRVDECYF